MLDTALHERDRELDAACAEHGFDPSQPLQIGGRYTSLVRDGRTLYLSGQIPRIGDHIAVTGVVGAEVSMERAKRAAAICALRCLTLLRQELGSLNKLQAVLRMTVFVHCEAGFTQQSEVADGASDMIWRVLGTAGAHTRTSVGALQLPKNASVEVDLIASTVEA
ncbi:enamine deaminase RidA (YjgF/YER057c/UK114 family) [Pelomonas saccharophila]|jgi:enamine deaminase RidA (YjgF/YER057c/UK114 family)|uniref:Enamine deaminase RidA (YjgF/YER057c/UK114 family) n=1 Tax=Roseateles saccharophilus TaxID=304 RepID=A0ABU1YMD4_ROSSA|nr:RidA family protein [Roseateles saccharophilus]MDR7270012.1 enamine deaminase RidA (YjgF/YER057c/UK114 family) [Roseateles saccharophilus]